MFHTIDTPRIFSNDHLKETTKNIDNLRIYHSLKSMIYR